MAKIFTKRVSEWDSNPGHPRDILNPLISASVASKREGRRSASAASKREEINASVTSKKEKKVQAQRARGEKKLF